MEDNYMRLTPMDASIDASSTTESSSSTPRGGQTVKSQCDLCKLSYTSKKELTEHLVSLMHHTKLEDKEVDPKHSCELCGYICSSMSQYRSHIATKGHQQELGKLRGDSGNGAPSHKKKNNKKKHQGKHSSQWKSKASKKGWTDSKDPFTEPYSHRLEHPHQSHWKSKAFRKDWADSKVSFTKPQSMQRSQNEDWGRNDKFHYFKSPEPNSSNNSPRDNKGQSPSINYGQASKSSQGYKGGFHSNWQQNYSRGGAYQDYDSPGQGYGNQGQGYAYTGIGFEYQGKGYENKSPGYGAKGQDDGNQDQGYQKGEGYERKGQGYQSRFQSYDHLSDGWQSGSMNRMPYNQNRPDFLKAFSTGAYNVNPFLSKNSFLNWNNGPMPNMDFTLDDFHGDWDEQSLTMQEQFLAGIAEENRQSENASSFLKVGHHRSASTESTGDGVAGKVDGKMESFVGKEYRKRPRAEEVVEESLAKASRSYKPGQFGQSGTSDGKDLPTVRKSLSSAREKELSKTDNILERAERMCREFREQRVSSQSQKQTVGKKSNNELINQRLSTLIHKQQQYIKGHVTDGPRKDEQTDSGLSSLSSQRSATTVLSSTSSPTAISQRDPSDRLKSIGSSLDEIRKSIEEKVLYTNKSAEKPSVVTAGKSRLLTRPLSLDRPRELVEVRTRNSAPARPVSTALSTDILKNMVNSPRSRVERVKLAKMQLQHPREEPKGPTRPGLQLEGLYDSDSSKVSLDIGDDKSTTIKLEDLSDDVRSQILSLIGEDMGSLGGGKEIVGRDVLPERESILVSDEESDSERAGRGSTLKSQKKEKSKKNKLKPKSVDQVGHKDSDLNKYARTKANKVSTLGSESRTSSYARTRDISSLSTETDSGNVAFGKSKTDVSLSSEKRGSSYARTEPVTSLDTEDRVGSYARTQPVVSLDTEDRVGSYARVISRQDRTGSGSDRMITDRRTASDASSLTRVEAPKTTQKIFLDQNSRVSVTTEKSGLTQLPSRDPSSRTTQLSSPEAGSGPTGQTIRDKYPTIMDTMGLHRDSTKDTNPDKPSQPSTISSAITSCSLSPSLTNSAVTRSYSPGLTLLSRPDQTSHEHPTNEMSIKTSFHSPSELLATKSALASQRSSSTLAPQRLFSSMTAEKSSSILAAEKPSSFLASQRSSSPLTSQRQLSSPSTQPYSYASANISTSNTVDVTQRSSSPNVSTRQPSDARYSTSAVPSRDETVQETRHLSLNSLGLGDGADNGSDSGSEMQVETASRTGMSEASSQAMTDLLMISEHEEEVKHEMQNLEKRLHRLHQVLEQAVVQIRNCSDKRKQLQETGQDLAKRRMSLLRAASSKSSASSVADVTSLGVHSELDTNPGPTHTTSVTAPPSSYIPTSTATTRPDISRSRSLSSDTPAVNDTDRIPGTSLTRADWIAKFASYLPKDIMQTITDNSTPGASLDTAPESPLYSLPTSERATPTSSLLIPERDPPVKDTSKPVSSSGGTVTSTSTINTVLGRDRFSTILSTSQPSKTALGIPTSISDSSNTEQYNTLHSSLHLSKTALGIPTSISGTSNSEQYNPVPSTAVFAMPTRSVPSSLSTTVLSPPVSTSATIRPPLNLMYVGSFTSPTTMKLSSVTSLLDRSLSGGKDTSTDHTGQSRTLTTGQTKTTARPLPEPPTSLSTLYSHHTSVSAAATAGDDSDIGSVASSMASGSSLGEQITRYCRSTPGASADVEGLHAHELSTILSAPSDTNSEVRGKDSQSVSEDEMGFEPLTKQDWERVVRPCSVDIERLDLDKGTGLYGKLNKDAVKSAEALHLLERNTDTNFATTSTLHCQEKTEVTMPTSPTEGKKKKMKTRHELEKYEETRRRRYWVVSSSDSEPETPRPSEDLDISAVTSRVCRSRVVSVSSDSDHSRGKLNSSVDMIKPSQPTRPNSVTVAECDSSTVDLDSLNQHSSTLLEMRDSFVKTFGRNPILTSGTVGAPSPSSNVITVGDGSSGDDISERMSLPDYSRNNRLKNNKNNNNPSTKDDDVVIVDDDVKSSRTGDKKNNEDSLLALNQSFDSALPRSKTASLSSLDVDKVKGSAQRTRDCIYPGSFGYVLDMCVLDHRLYVGYRSYGIRVYDFDLNTKSSSAATEYLCSDLSCMAVTRDNNSSSSSSVSPMIIAGGKGTVDINKLSDGTSQTFSTATVAKCMLVMSPLLYLGLQSGEITVFDLDKLQEKTTFLCTDRPIHCLAPAQEGYTKLICASAQDGAIVVVDVNSCLPLRILVGHRKTAFSIQVSGHLVYSGSGDGAVLAQNLHTSTLEHVYREGGAVVNSVCYQDGYLFTGGMDKLIRCFDTKSHELVQVFYGADRGIVTSVKVHDNKLISGTSCGAVDVVELNLHAEHRCHKSDCGLNFGSRRHLFWHILDDHSIAREQK